MSVIGTMNIDIFNPLCTTKQSVEQYLKSKNQENVTYRHPFGSKEYCYYNKVTNIQWIRNNESIDPSSLLAKNSNLANIENNIEKRIKEYGLESLKLYGKNIKIQPIPDGQEILECYINADEISSSPPPLFVISRVILGNFFDLVIHPLNSHPNDNPLYWHKPSITDYPFIHSGDIRPSNILIQYMTLDVNKIHRSNNGGIITTHAFKQKSFIDIASSEPNICFVNYSKDNVNDITIYIKHFPLIKDFVKKSSISHICKFEYFPDEKKIRWKIPQHPEFDDKKITVGINYAQYEEGIKKFKRKIDLMNNYNNSNTVTTTTIIHTTMEVDNDDHDFTLIFL